MSTLQVTKITTVDNTTPLILSTGNAGGGQIIVQSSNTDVFFNGNINFSSYVTGDGSGLYIPSSNVANMAFNTANAAFASANNVAPQVTPAYNTANSAFNTANAAFASANNVAPQVTPAFNTANLAFLNSNVAFNTANAAYAAANNITPQIAPSYNTANSSYNTANAAYGYANVSNTYAESTFLKLTAPSQTVTGNLTVTGNFTLLGNATTVSSNNLIVGDSMIYLAANNYSGTDILDIGFLANYANGTGANVHTGLLRDATTKQYYLFNGLDIELQANNTAFTPYANGVTNAVLNADLYTSNLSLGGANAINWITAAFAKANVPEVNVGQTAPTGAVAGKLWWNSDLGKLFVYYTDPANTSAWIETSPSASSIEASIITGYINPIYNTVNASYSFANSAYASINSNWTVTNAVYVKANTALQNTSGVLSGSLYVTGNLASGLASTSFPMETVSDPTTAISLKIRGRSSTNDSAIRWYSNDGVTQQGYVQFGGQAEIAVVTSDHLIVKTNSTTRMKIDAYGNTGFGAAASQSPKSRLHTSSSGTTLDMGLGYVGTNTSFYMTNSDSAYGLVGGVAGNGDTYLQSQRVDGTATAYNIIMQNYGGNVAIGGTSARTTLDLDRKSTRLNSSHTDISRMPSSA